MFQSAQSLIDSTGAVPVAHPPDRGPWLLALYAGSDALLALACISVPLAILYLSRGRRDVAFSGIPLLFSGFIVACALTQVLALIGLWWTAYGLLGWARAVCAAASAVMALAIWRRLPQLVALPGPEAHARKAAELEAEVARRRQAESALSVALNDVSQMNAELETRVAQRTADLTEANEELERFAYIASHDLRAPLRALMTIPEWLRETLADLYGGVSPRLELDLHEMEVQSRRMDRLLSDLLTYARIGQSGEFWSVIDPEPPIRESARLAAMPPGFELAVEGPLPGVRCIPTEFSLIIRNLISNAIKHHDRGEGRITIRGWKEPGLTVMEVRDDGPGIPARHADKVFDMFSTLRPRDEVEGSGMGLAMVKKIMDRAGGWVRLVEPAGRSPPAPGRPWRAGARPPPAAARPPRRPPPRRCAKAPVSGWVFPTKRADRTEREKNSLCFNCFWPKTATSRCVI